MKFRRNVMKFLFSVISFSLKSKFGITNYALAYMFILIHLYTNLSIDTLMQIYILSFISINQSGYISVFIWWCICECISTIAVAVIGSSSWCCKSSAICTLYRQSIVEGARECCAFPIVIRVSSLLCESNTISNLSWIFVVK